jgi:hypothetical protein
MREKIIFRNGKLKEIIAGKQKYLEMVQGLSAMLQLSPDFILRDNQQRTYEW